MPQPHQQSACVQYFFYYDQSPYNSYKLVTSNLFLFMNSEYSSPEKIKKYSSEDVN